MKIIQGGGSEWIFRMTRVGVGRGGASGRGGEICVFKSWVNCSKARSFLTIKHGIKWGSVNRWGRLIKSAWCTGADCTVPGRNPATGSVRTGPRHTRKSRVMRTRNCTTLDFPRDSQNGDYGERAAAPRRCPSRPDPARRSTPTIPPTLDISFT